MLAEWIQLLESMFVNDIFGSKMLFGVFIVGFAGYFAFKTGMSFSAFAIALGFLVMILAGGGYLPNWLIFIFAMTTLFIVGLALLKVGRR